MRAAIMLGGEIAVEFEAESAEGCNGAGVPVGGAETGGVARGGGEEARRGFDEVDAGGGRAGVGGIGEVVGCGHSDDSRSDDDGVHCAESEGCLCGGGEETGSDMFS